ncbi:MAG: toll/interleukin-1 receptor domain-containing protein [Chitinophagales bacterium]
MKVKFAYSRKDVKYMENIRKYLQLLEKQDKVKLWYDGDIEVGSNWEAMIKKHLENADIILPLISANALASDYFYDTEMKIALDRHSKKQVKIIPVILKSCLWQSSPFGELQALPEDGKPIESWERESEAYANVMEHITDLCFGENIKKARLQKQNEK